MAMDLNEVKINVRSLLTSSQNPLSILQLQRDYRKQEGCNIPYKSLGFSSVIELLKNMTDVVTVPPNPNESSMLSLVFGDKTKHLRMLVVKQKMNTSQNKGKSNTNNRILHENQKKNKKIFGRSVMNRNGTSHKANSSYGYVTDYLRSDKERYLHENQLLITSNTLKQIVQKHPDYSITDIHSVHDSKDQVKDLITLNENQGFILESARLNIEAIFKVYCKGVNIKNFKFIYKELYNTIGNPIDFDSSSIKQMLMVLNQIVEERNNVLYTKDEFKLNEKEDLENDNICLLKYNNLNDETITTSIRQPILSFNQDKKKMLLVKTYDPSLFYLQLEPLELDRLMIQMQYTYETKSNNYLVEPNQILPGLFYATSYSSFSNPKQWYRVKVLKVNSTTVEVIHVDYGTVDNNIPKNELRFLNYKLCSLPCQVIHCCLTGYNELDSIAPEVTKAFLEIINIDKNVLVTVDDHFIISKQYQILHVTLFQYKSNDSKTLENINDELTIWHLNKL